MASPAAIAINEGTGTDAVSAPAHANPIQRVELKSKPRALTATKVQTVGTIAALCWETG